MAREITAPLPPGLGKILSEGSFSVPSHQRDYSWRQDEVSLLLDDVETVNQHRTGTPLAIGGTTLIQRQ